MPKPDGKPARVSIIPFCSRRLGLVIGEAPVYPATLKSLAEWALKQERGNAAGFVHFGVMIAAIAGPLTIPWMTENWGWQSCCMLSGVLGFIVLIPWVVIYRSPEEHPRISPEERALVLGSRVEKTQEGGVQWLSLFRYRQLWACIALQAVVNPAWWFLTYWLPKFMGETFEIRGVAMPPPSSRRSI